jgi:hypothetical protein
LTCHCRGAYSGCAIFSEAFTWIIACFAFLQLAVVSLAGSVFVIIAYACLTRPNAIIAAIAAKFSKPFSISADAIQKFVRLPAFVGYAHRRITAFRTPPAFT